MISFALSHIWLIAIGGWMLCAAVAWAFCRAVPDEPGDGFYGES